MTAGSTILGCAAGGLPACKSIPLTIRLAFIARNDYVAPTDISRMTLAPLTSLLMIAWMKTAY